MTALNDRAFQAFARAYPTEKVSDGPWGALWRIAFYTLAPSERFVMRTPHYKLWAHPKKGTLTRAVIRRGHWEATLTRLYLPFLKPGQFVIDAGANFGHFGLTAAGKVGPTGRVVSFEPHGPTYALLQSNVELNGFTWMTPVRAALADQEGETVIVSDSANAGGHSLDAGNVEKVSGQETVAMHTIDGWLAANEPNRRVDILKVDVQGFEAHLLQGAAQMLKRDKPVVFLEVAPVMVRHTGRTVAEVLKPFADLGYSAQMVWDSQNRVEDASWDEIEAYCEAPDGHIDLVLTPPAG